MVARGLKRLLTWTGDSLRSAASFAETGTSITFAQQLRYMLSQGLDDPILGLFTLALLLEVIYV